MSRADKVLEAKEMDIFHYFCSPDIVAYCKKIDHVFNPLEMAVIVANSSKTVKEKHAAWRQIISEYPDMSIHESFNFNAQKSLHKYLYEYITWQENWLANFNIPDEMAIYQAMAQGEYDYCGCFSTFNNALQSLYMRNEDYKIESIIIKKEYIDRYLWNNTILINSDREVIDYYCFDPNQCYELPHPDTLDMIFIHIPVPFEEGDIVEYKGKPYVLASLPHWDEPRYADFISGKTGDGSDMIADLYFIDEHGQLSRDWGPPFYYWKLKHFRGELQGQERFFKYLSNHLKSKDEKRSIDWLFDAFSKFQREAKCAEQNRRFDNLYISLDEYRQQRQNRNTEKS